MRLLVLIIALVTSIKLQGSEMISEPFFVEGDTLQNLTLNHEVPKIKRALHTAEKKITAIALAVLLGPFGVHRLYLGTRPLVPIVYTLTLGGGLGLLPLTDIIAIITTKDFEQYKNNTQIIMWAK